MKACLKYRIIQKFAGQYPVLEMCRLFEVSRSGYYEFVKRIDKPERDEGLATLIARCQEISKKTYGYRRVHIWLERQGVCCNPKTVLRVMHKYGLLSEVRRRKKYKAAGQHIHRYENRLNRNFGATLPNQKWVTDISYIHTAQGTLYLSIIRDLFDLSIVAHRTATQQTAHLVLNTIKDAQRKRTAAGELQLHSDQGLQYTSHAYHSLTQEYGIIPSMSRRGNCLDNAMAENFFSILKTECIHRQEIDSFSQANELIDDYIHFYNYERLQLKTKLTPIEKRRQLA